MANPTTNYGFVLPTSSNLVTDLPADFDVALQGVDTRLKALQPGTTLGDLVYSSSTANTNTRLAVGSTGQVLTVASGVPSWATPSSGAVTLITSGTISSAANSGTTFDGVFTSTYVNYLVLLSGLSHSAGAVNLLLQYRSAGPTTKTNEYYGGKQNLVAAGSVTNEYYNGGASTGVILSYLHTSASSNAKLHITGVGNSSQRALAHGTGFSGQGSAAFNTGFQCADADTYTGFILSVASGTFSGTIKVYGVSN